MRPHEMLRILGEHGEEAGSDFNDGDDVLGWFGWTVGPPEGHPASKSRQLTITYEDMDNVKQTASWVLVPLPENESDGPLDEPSQPG